MTKYVAMIRGIGPGNPNMSAEKFSSLFEGLGFKNVDVVLSSGNVIFESTEINEETIALSVEKALPEKLGFTRSVIIRNQSELQQLVDTDPFEGKEHTHNKDSYLLITFFRNQLHIPFKLPYTPDNKPYTLLGSTDNVVYGTIDLLKSKTPDYMAWLEKQFGKDITSRTPKTIRLIISRMDKSKVK